MAADQDSRLGSRSVLPHPSDEPSPPLLVVHRRHIRAHETVLASTNYQAVIAVDLRLPTEDVAG
jgi:hypothetical protein